MSLSNKELLQNIKDEVAKSHGADDWNDLRDSLPASVESTYWPIVCERFATEKAKASCEATLKKASENAKVQREQMINWDTKEKTIYSELYWSTKDEYYQVDKSSITDTKNIVLLPKEKTEREILDAAYHRNESTTRDNKGAMSYSEGDYKQFEEIASRQRDIEPEIAEVLTKHGHELFESSEPQEKEPYILEVVGNFLHSSGLVFNTDDADHVASDLINYMKVEGLTINKDTPAPVESQEELWKAVMFVINLCKEKECDPVISLSGIFSITRLTP